MVLTRQNRVDKAARHFLVVLRLKPDSETARHRMEVPERQAIGLSTKQRVTAVIILEEAGMARARKEWKIIVGAALLLAMLSDCASSLSVPADVGQEKAGAMLTGRVTCRIRTVLPPEAYVQVELVDITRQNAPARTIAMQEIPLEGRQIPVPFRIAYGPAAIDPSHTYAVQVRIATGQRILFVNNAIYRVLTNGVRHNIEVVVEPIPGSGY